jgi:hypothetical protein
MVRIDKLRKPDSKPKDSKAYRWANDGAPKMNKNANSAESLTKEFAFSATNGLPLAYREKSRDP